MRQTSLNPGKYLRIHKARKLTTQLSNSSLYLRRFSRGGCVGQRQGARSGRSTSRTRWHPPLVWRFLTAAQASSPTPEYSGVSKFGMPMAMPVRGARKLDRGRRSVHGSAKGRRGSLQIRLRRLRLHVLFIKKARHRDLEKSSVLETMCSTHVYT